MKKKSKKTIHPFTITVYEQKDSESRRGGLTIRKGRIAAAAATAMRLH